MRRCRLSGTTPVGAVDFLGLVQCPDCGAWLRPTPLGAIREHRVRRLLRVVR